MPEKRLLEMESEKEEIREFIELFKGMPQDSRRDIKLLMVYANFAGGNKSEVERKRA